jgi:glucose-6-phosphate isomerase
LTIVRMAIKTMIKINFENLGDLKIENYQDKLEQIKSMKIPSFESEIPNLDEIKSQMEKYAKYKNIILIGNGGSRTSAYAFYNALFDFRNDVNFEFLTSSEPDWIFALKKKYSPEDTLIIAISKSGDNINNLEPLMSFLDYPGLVITGSQQTVLRKIAEKMGWEIIIHPEVGGRFSAMTSCGLVPAYLMGLDIDEIYEGAVMGHERYSIRSEISENDALKLAIHFFQLEKTGYEEIFASIYSLGLSGLLPLIIQLIHESAGKDGFGQTILGDYSPESQHHTNQRFFGGKKNMIGMLMGVEESKEDFEINIPEDLKKIDFKDEKLEMLQNLKASQTMLFDLKGVFEHCLEKKIPVVEIFLNKINPRAIGEMIVFWQYFSVYSAMLRGVDPYDQPEVEFSKIVSFNLRKNR